MLAFCASAQTSNVTTVAGTPTVSGYSGDGANATGAQLATPYGLGVDSAGNVYIADSANANVRKVTLSTGAISTVFTGSYLTQPTGVAVDQSGNVYIADPLAATVWVASNGGISAFAGSGTAGFSGDGGLAIKRPT